MRKSESPNLKDVKSKLGIRFRKLRIQKGHNSLEAFAMENDISRPLYSNYESGKGNITIKNLTKVLSGLDVSLKEFFSEGFE